MKRSWISLSPKAKNHLMFVAWKVVGVCSDCLCVSILIQQFLGIWRLSKEYNHILINAGILFGGLFLVFARALVFHAFQRPFAVGTKVKTQHGIGTVESINLLFSTVCLKDDTKCLFWNLEAYVDRSSDLKKVRWVTTWDFHLSGLLNVFDAIFSIVSVTLVILMVMYDTSMFAIYSTAAINSAIYVLLLLSAQIGILRILYPSDEKVECTEFIPFYEGIFMSFGQTDDGHTAIVLNASTRLKLDNDRVFGPYI